MGAISLSGGVVRSMTRGAPGRPSDDAGPGAGMTLLDKMNLLHLIAENPPQELDDLIDEVRRGGTDGAATLFGRLKAMAEGGSDG